jgi:hypothetical protein
VLYGAKAGLEVVVVEKRSGTIDMAGADVGEVIPASTPTSTSRSA